MSFLLNCHFCMEIIDFIIFFICYCIYYSCCGNRCINRAKNMVDRDPTTIIILRPLKWNNWTGKYHELGFNVLIFSGKILNHTSVPLSFTYGYNISTELKIFLWDKFWSIAGRLKCKLSGICRNLMNFYGCRGGWDKVMTITCTWNGFRWQEPFFKKGLL